MQTQTQLEQDRLVEQKFTADTCYLGSPKLTAGTSSSEQKER